MGKQKIFFSEAEKKQASAGGNRGNPTPKAFKSSSRQTAPVNIIKPGAPNTRQNKARETADKVIIIKPGTPAAAALLARKQRQQPSNKTKINRPQAPIVDHQGRVPMMIPAQSQPTSSSSRQQQPRQLPPAHRPASQTALQTAAAIAGNRSHPNHAEVLSLIQTFEKGWIDEAWFTELLQGMLF